MAEDKVGLANPYALVEIALGRAVNWNSIIDRDELVQETFGLSLDELLSPKEGNLVVSGMATSQEVLSEIHKVKADKLSAVTSSVKRGPVSSLLKKLPLAARARIIGALGGAEAAAGKAYLPAGSEWADPGSFFKEAAEFFDPVQGGLGDCYFIAALSAISWARPYVVMQRSRATSASNPSFVDQINFHSGGKTIGIEVTELVPLVVGTHAWIYARSSEAGEIWPAVYEKAFAKWKTHCTTDQPDYGPIAGGWPVQATSEVANLKGTTKTCSSLTADQIWSLIRSNCMSFRTFNPMTAWTYCVSNPPVNYGGTGILRLPCVYDPRVGLCEQYQVCCDPESLGPQRPRHQQSGRKLVRL